MASILNVDQINNAAGTSAITIDSNGNALMPGHVVQVKNALKTNKQTITSTLFIDITDLSVSITPSSTSSKIIVIANLHVGHDTINYCLCNIVRDSTAIGQPSGSNLYPATMNSYTGDNVSGGLAIMNSGMTLLDTPNTTNATTYKIQARTTSGTATINGRPANGNGATVSSITVMEIAQ